MYNGCPAWFFQCFIDCDCNYRSENSNQRFLINISLSSLSTEVKDFIVWKALEVLCHPKSLIFLFNLNKSSPRHSNHRIMTQVSRALCFLISQFWGRTWVGTSFFISAVKSVLIRACCKYAALVNSVMAVGSLFFILWFLQACIYQVVTVGIQSL